MTLLIQAANVRHAHGGNQIFTDVSFEVREGDRLALIGANGAGKSTLMRTAAGLQPPDFGRVRVGDIDLWAGDPVEAKKRLGYAAEEPAFYEELSAGEYLAFVAAVRALPPADAEARATDLLGRLALADRSDEPVHRFSHGMRKKLSFVAAVLHRPPVLLCDEALEGFDAASNLAAKDELRALAAAGSAILFSSHVTETVERLCDRAVLLHKGKVARLLDRAAWGGPEPGPSPLEREFLEVSRHG